MDDIKANIACGEYPIVDNPTSKAKLDILEKSSMIRDCENSIVSGYAACKKCQKVLACDSHKLATWSLRKPIDSCRSTGAATIDKFLCIKRNQ